LLAFPFLLHPLLLLLLTRYRRRQLWAIDRTKDGAISGTSKAALLCRDGHKASVHAIAINHNSTRAVTASKDGSWKLWNIDGTHGIATAHSRATSTPPPF